jgi:hypothetical protein
MSFQSIIHGRILSLNYEKDKKFIESIDYHETWPPVISEMFNIQKEEHYNYYVISFAMSYKEVETDWTTWLIKFEHILKNLDFDTAKVQLESDLYPSFNFFWKNKKWASPNFDNPEYVKKMELSESDNWFYGYGLRSIWGHLEDSDLSKKREVMFDFLHPFKIDKELVEYFNEYKASASPKGKLPPFYKSYPDTPHTNINFIPLITKLLLEGKIILTNDEEDPYPFRKCYKLEEGFVLEGD